MKKLISLCLVLAVFCVTQVFGAAARTSSQSGNWSSTSTWGGATPPGTTDTAYISGDHIVTLTTAVSCNTVLVGATANASGIATLIINAGGTLTMESGGNFKVGNSTGKDGKFTMGPGGALVNATTFYFNNGYLDSTATAASPFVLTGAGNISVITVTGPRQSIALTNISFQGTGAYTFNLQDTTGTASSSMYFSHCVFYGQRQLTFGATDTPNTVPMSIADCDFRNMVTTRTITFQRVTGGTATYEFVRNTLQQPLSGVNAITLIPQTSTGLLIAGNVWDNAKFSELSPGGSIISNNFHTSRQAVSGFGSLNSTTAGSVVNNYIRPSGNNGSGLGSNGASGATTQQITGNIFEGFYDGVTYLDKPDFWLPGTTPLASDYTFNLIIGTGEHVVGYNIPNWKTVNAKNNTSAMFVYGDSGGHLYEPENTASSGTINLANNLMRGNGNVVGVSIGGSSSGANQVIAYSDYNNFYNQFLAYDATRLTITAGNTGKTVPGSHDIALNPMFYDETRNLAKWNLLYGSGVNTSDAAITYLLGINGYRDTPNFDQNGTVSTRGPWNLTSWVKQGFLATNPALRAAGDPSDGSPDIGIGYTGLKGAIGTFFGSN